MTSKRIQIRLNLLKSLSTAFQEAKTAGVKEPLTVLRQALRSRADYKVKKASQENRTK